MVDRKIMCTFALAKTERGVAQLVAFLVWDQAVAGSSPVTSTKRTTFLKVVLFFLYILTECIVCPHKRNAATIKNDDDRTCYLS